MYVLAGMEVEEIGATPTVEPAQVPKLVEEQAPDEEQANGTNVISPLQDLSSSPKAIDDEDTSGRSWKPLTFRIKL